MKNALWVFTGLLFSLTSSAQFGGEIKITPEMMKLSYQPDEGDGLLNCTAHYLYENNPYDFKVLCSDEQGTLKKELNLHLALTILKRPQSPLVKMKIQIMFWVNGEGAVTWLTFDHLNEFRYYEGSQSIKGEPAALHLEFAVPHLK